jgi:peptide/nickel transport system permease protein
LVILLAIASITFALERVVPANPAAFLAGQNASVDTVARIKHQYGLDQPISVQYVTYMTGLLHGDLGLSFRTRRPVIQDLIQFLPATLELLLVSFIIYIALSIGLGILAAQVRGRRGDSIIRLVTMVGTGIPVFWLGLMLQLVFFHYLHWLPLDGRYPVREDLPPAITNFLLLDSVLRFDPAEFVNALSQLVLPVTAIVLSLLAVGVRLTRGAFIEQGDRPYVRTLRGKGLRSSQILFKHVLRNALNPIITTTGTQFGYMVSWVVLVEVIFNWPGIGLYAFKSFEVFDYAPVIALTLVSTIVFATVNLASDLLYPVVDPRVQRATG